MLRGHLAPILLLALASCVAPTSEPARVAGLPEYPPPVAARAPSSPSASASAPVEPAGPFVALEGTTWTGPDSDGTEWSFEFKRGGTLRYWLSGSVYDNGSWKQEGARVLIETNNHYADFTGRIRGRQITGSAHNKAGKSWTWVADRQP